MSLMSHSEQCSNRLQLDLISMFLLLQLENVIHRCNDNRGLETVAGGQGIEVILVLILTAQLWFLSDALVYVCIYNIGGTQ